MNKLIAFILIFLLALPVCAVNASKVKASSKNITVPDDYPTIAAALGNATEGNTILVKKGTYNETTLETNKTLSLIGEGAELTRINLNPQSSHQKTIEGWGMNGYYIENITLWDNSITFNANETTISGVTILSPGDGSIIGDKIQLIRANITVPILSITGSWSKITESKLTTLIVNGSYSRIEENSANALYIFGSYLAISRNTALGNIGVTGEYCKISENSAIGVRDFGSGIISLNGSYCEISSNNLRGISLEASSCFVHDNNVTEDKNNGRGSIAGNGNIVANNLFDHLAFGIELSGSNNLVCKNRITRNGEGLVASGKSNTIYANYVANNGWGVDTGHNGASATLYCNNFVDNRFQVSTIFPVNQIDYFDNGTAGNYWNNYNGTDTDGDGRGDIPFIIDSTRSDRYPLISPFDIDVVTVTAPEWTKNLPTSQPLPTLQPFPDLTPNPSITPMPSIPEFPSWVILSTVLFTTLLVVLLIKRKSNSSHSSQIY
jgi:nitrous oxidase accessory protein